MSATVLAYLTSRREAVALQISKLTDPNEAIDNTAGSLPEHTGKAAVKHQQYKKGLYDELEYLENRIAAIEGGWEIISEVET